jgi:cysteate synthase
MSWKSGRRELVEIGHDDGKKLIKQTVAHVLSNQRPPYSSNGGVFDVLTESQGDMLTADNLEALHAKRLFEDTEGIDIDPAAAVAFATLIKAARYGELEKEALVLLNITGGGRLRQQRDKKLIDVRPSVEITEEEHHRADTIDRIVGMFY